MAQTVWHNERLRKGVAQNEETGIPAKGITGTIIDIFVGSDGVTYYTIENEVWGDVDDPDAWNIGYAEFTCTVEQLAHINGPET